MKTLKTKRIISLKGLDKKLWKIFSEYIRLRDSFEQDGERFFKCISCGKIKPFNQMHAGHYYSRKAIHKAIKFSELNVNGQCNNCNTFDEGNKPSYTLGLIKKYGEGILEKLDAQKFNKCFWKRFEYETLIKEYQYKLTMIKK